MNRYVVAHFSSFNGELKHTIIEADSEYSAAVQMLAPTDTAEFCQHYPTYEALQLEYVPAVEEWLSVLRIS